MGPAHPLFPLSGDSRQARAIRSAETRPETPEERLYRAIRDARKGFRPTRSQRRLLGAMGLDVVPANRSKYDLTAAEYSLLH